MTQTVKHFLNTLQLGEYKKKRLVDTDFGWTDTLRTVSDWEIHTVLFEEVLAREIPVFLEGDVFGFNRYQTHLPFFKKNKGGLGGYVPGNFTPNYARLMGQGFDALLEEIRALRENVDSERCRFYDLMERDLLAVLNLVDRYRVAAKAQGLDRLADVLERIPRQPAETFYEACVFFKILIFTLRCANCDHMTLGRFDQYMLPYFSADLARGISRESLFETLELFFIALNVDGDIYNGIQQGDNGQSLVLGGFDRDGNDMFNELSHLCMEASLELSLIDPKINLRVSKKTPDWQYELGTKLTKQGLGFPQYCNDDIIIPYMLSLGYDEEDAYNYTVAACWEVISPNNGFDVPNRGTFSFPLVIDRAVQAGLTSCATFDAFLEVVRREMIDECAAIRKKWAPQVQSRHIVPIANYVSLFVDGCLEKGLDLTQGGARYHNFGCHGAGISTAADALAAIRKLVFDDHTVTAAELIEALNADFEGYELLRNALIACPKMGNGDPYVDDLACFIMDVFASNMNGKPNDFWGIWRAGTGSAMEYIRVAKDCPATADGRRSGEPFGCSFSPSLTAKTDGPLSVIRSFTRYDMTKIANGGPLTMELHDTVFRNEEGERKVAQLVKAYVHMGGHQLQLNSINRERLLEAEAHPENYPNLIVRVWGWSGYFCELDPVYRAHIIRRTEYCV